RKALLSVSRRLYAAGVLRQYHASQAINPRKNGAMASRNKDSGPRLSGSSQVAKTSIALLLRRYCDCLYVVLLAGHGSGRGFREIYSPNGAVLQERAASRALSARCIVHCLALHDELGGGDIGRQRHVVHVADALQALDVRIVGVCAERIDDEDYRPDTALGDARGDLHVAAQRTGEQQLDRQPGGSAD